MPLTTTKLIQHWKAAQRDEQNKIAKSPSHYFRCLFIASLSYTERRVYDFVANRGEVSSHAVANHFALSLSHALNVLGHLHQYGLVTKCQNPDSKYREYLWSIASEDE